MTSQFTTRGWLIAFVCAALLLRLGLAVKTGLNAPPPKLGSDADEYDTCAWNLAQGRGYRGPSPGFGRDNLTAYRVPGTSLIWAGLYRAFGHRYGVVRIFQCLVGAVTVLIIYEIGQRAFSEKIGLVASAIYSVWPMAIFYSAQLLSETLATFWFLAYVAASLWFAAKPAPNRACLAGLLLGLALLTKGGFVIMIPFAVVWAVWQFWAKKPAIFLALTIPLISLLILTPWIARNYRVFGHFIPLATEGGDTLLGGNNSVVAYDPEYYGHQIFPTLIPEYRNAFDSCSSEIERDHLAVSLTIRWLKEHPDRWCYLVQAKLRRSMTPFLRGNNSTLSRVAMLATWGPVLILFLPAFFLTLVPSVRNRRPAWLLHLAILHLEITCVIFSGIVRFRFPIEGLCIIFACVSALWLWDKLRGAHA
jgi:4-amino-4-deoxy-L-arabinose transferase-like glycosyltransferase